MRLKLDKNEIEKRNNMIGKESEGNRKEKRI